MADINELKFITKENLNTFAKYLKVPKSNIEITKIIFEKNTKEKVTVGETNLQLVFNGSGAIASTPYGYGYGYGYGDNYGYGNTGKTYGYGDNYGYGYGYGYGHDHLNEPGGFNDGYYCAIKANQDCILFYLSEEGEYCLLDCKKNEEQILSFDDTITKFSMFFIATYNTI